MSDTAIENIESLKSHLKTVSIIDGENGRAFTVRGWPFALVRNGPAWDILGAGLMETCVDADTIVDTIQNMVLDLEAENAGWDFDPDGIEI